MSVVPKYLGHFPYPLEANISVWFTWSNQPGRISMTSKLAKLFLVMESNMTKQSGDH